MRRLGLVAAGVIALSIAATGCAKKDGAAGSFDADRYFADLKTEKFVVRKAEAFDVDVVIAALPSGWAVDYASSDFDARSGATILSGVTFSAADNPDIGLKAEEISIWGGDSAGIANRLSGAGGDQTLAAASRVEASNLELFGLETLMSPLMDASNAMVEGLASGDPDMAEVDLSTTMDSYEFSMEKLVMTDFGLHPSVLSLTDVPFDGDAEDDDAEAQVV